MKSKKKCLFMKDDKGEVILISKLLFQNFKFAISNNEKRLIIKKIYQVSFFFNNENFLPIEFKP